MPFKSEAQRRYLWANEPGVAREFANATPKGTKLPAHVKKAFQLGVDAALSRFGFKSAGEELRLKIPDRTFHAWEAAHRNESARGQKKMANPFGDRRNAEDLAQMLNNLEDIPHASNATASKNPLDRTTSWGPPSNPSAGDSGSRATNLGPSGSFGGI